MTACKNPSSASCLKFNPRPGVNFCQACGSAASAVGVAVIQGVTGVPVATGMPTVSGPKFVNVVKPQLNQQAMRHGLMSSLQAQRAQRLPANLSSGLMAAAGVVLGSGLSLIVISTLQSGDEPNSVVGFIMGVICLGLSWIVASWLPEAFRPAGVSAANILVVTTAFATLNSLLQDGNLGVVLLFASLLSALLWVLPGTAGRPSIQALGIGYLSAALVVLSVQSRLRSYINDLADFEFGNPLDLAESVFRDASTLSLIIGAGLIGFAHRLDRQKWSNLATPFLAVGIVWVVSAGWGLAVSSGLAGEGDSSIGSSLLLLPISAGLIYVGGYAGRRFTLALGTWFITFDLLVLVLFLSGDEPSFMTLALLMLIVGSAASFAVFKSESRLGVWTTPKP